MFNYNYTVIKLTSIMTVYCDMQAFAWYDTRLLVLFMYADLFCCWPLPAAANCSVHTNSNTWSADILPSSWNSQLHWQHFTTKNCQLSVSDGWWNNSCSVFLSLLSLLWLFT